MHRCIVVSIPVFFFGRFEDRLAAGLRGPADAAAEPAGAVVRSPLGGLQGPIS